MDINKFYKRFLVALLGLPLIVLFLYGNTISSVIFSLVCVSIGYSEACSIRNISKTDPVFYLGIIALFLVQLSFIVSYNLIFISIVITFIILFLLVVKNVSFDMTTYIWFFIVYLNLGFFALNTIFTIDRFLLLYIILLVWIFDISCYIFGSNFGKHKIFKVSPNKSVEGLIGGFFTTIIFSVLLYYAFHYLIINHFPHISSQSHATLLYKSLDFWNILQVSVRYLLIVIPFALFGDLLISQVKRTHNVKDTSTILKEHGGFLDRLDSIIPVLIIVLFQLAYV